MDEPNKAEGCREVVLSKESLQAVEKVFKKALHESLNEEAAKRFWRTGFGVLKNNATAAGGNMLYMSVVKLFKGIGKFLAIGLLVYSIGGWSMLAAIFKLLVSKGDV